MDSLLKTVSEKMKFASLIAAVALILSQVLVILRPILNYLFGFYYSLDAGTIILILLCVVLAAALAGGMFAKIANVLAALPLAAFLLSHVISLFKQVGYLINYTHIVNASGIIYYLLQIIGIVLIIVCAVHTTVTTPLSPWIKKLWFIPCIVFIVAFAGDFLVSLVSSAQYNFSSIGHIIGFLLTTLINLFWAVGFALAGAGISSHLILKEEETETAPVVDAEPTVDPVISE